MKHYIKLKIEVKIVAIGDDCVRENKKLKIFSKMIFNPLFILVYAVAWHNLYVLCKFGRDNKHIGILLTCLVFFVVYLIIFICQMILIKRERLAEELNVYQNNYEEVDISEDGIINTKKETNLRIKSIWKYIGAALLVIITVFYGYKVYYTGTKYNGALSWYLEDLFNKEEVTFTHDNIFEDGIDGLITDIDKKLDLPDDIYVYDTFKIDFNEDGKITSIDTFIYGKDEKGELKSFLITYDEKQSKKMTVNLNGYASGDFSEDKSLQPFVDTMKVINVKDIVDEWSGENKYGILYCGKRSFGYNTEGIRFINGEGKEKGVSTTLQELIGYTVSVYVPGKEESITPVRYNLVKDLDNLYEYNEVKDENEFSQTAKEDVNAEEEFFLSDKVGYRLSIEGAALGSRFYSLEKSIDGGLTWSILNEDPFNGMSGGSSRVTFIDDNLGFISLSHGGGDNAQLYRTIDGGKTFDLVNFPEHKVSLGNGEEYNPYDFPEMPYREDDILYVKVGQGADGDYNGNSMGLYKSNDNGETFEYVNDVK